MKKLFSMMLVVLMLSFAGTASAFGMGSKNKAVQKKSTKSDYTAPDFQLKDVFGKTTLDPRDYRGKVVLINFWATWCPPCRQEIPDLIKLYKKYQKDFVVLGLSVDKNGTQGVRDFVKKMKMPYPVALATQDVVFDYGGITGIPTTFILNRQGELVQKIVGFRNFEQFESYIKPYLKEK